MVTFFGVSVSILLLWAITRKMYLALVSRRFRYKVFELRDRSIRLAIEEKLAGEIGGKTKIMKKEDSTVYIGYAIIFNIPDSQGNVIMPDSFDSKDFQKMKLSGNIIDYEIDEIGVKVTKKLTPIN